MEKRTLILLFTLVLDIIGIAFLGVGIGLCIRGRKKRSTCTKLVTATVVDMQRESVGGGDSSASGEVRLKSWFPVYEYAVDGAKQRVKALIGTAQPERMVGETVELFVNPGRANEFYCPTEKRSCIQNVFKDEQSAIGRFNRAKQEREAAFKKGSLSDAEKSNIMALSQPGLAFWASKGYRTFHRRNCPQITGLNQLVGFPRYQDAARAGYCPCRHCKPSPKQDVVYSIPTLP